MVLLTACAVLECAACAKSQHKSLCIFSNSMCCEIETLGSTKYPVVEHTVSENRRVKTCSCWFIYLTIMFAAHLSINPSLPHQIEIKLEPQENYGSILSPSPTISTSVCSSIKNEDSPSWSTEPNCLDLKEDLLCQGPLADLPNPPKSENCILKQPKVELEQLSLSEFDDVVHDMPADTANVQEPETDLLTDAEQGLALKPCTSVEDKWQFLSQKWDLIRKRYKERRERQARCQPKQKTRDPMPEEQKARNTKNQRASRRIRAARRKAREAKRMEEAESVRNHSKRNLRDRKLRQEAGSTAKETEHGTVETKKATSPRLRVIRPKKVQRTKNRGPTEEERAKEKEYRRKYKIAVNRPTACLPENIISGKRTRKERTVEAEYTSNLKGPAMTVTANPKIIENQRRIQVRKEAEPVKSLERYRSTNEQQKASMLEMERKPQASSLKPLKEESSEQRVKRQLYSAVTEYMAKGQEKEAQEKSVAQKFGKSIGDRLAKLSGFNQTRAFYEISKVLTQAEMASMGFEPRDNCDPLTDYPNFKRDVDP